MRTSTGFHLGEDRWLNFGKGTVRVIGLSDDATDGWIHTHGQESLNKAHATVLFFELFKVQTVFLDRQFVVLNGLLIAVGRDGGRYDHSILAVFGGVDARGSDLGFAASIAKGQSHRL